MSSNQLPASALAAGFAATEWMAASAVRGVPDGPQPVATLSNHGTRSTATRRKETAFRACLKIGKGPAARDFVFCRGDEVRASPQRAVRTESTKAEDKSTAARRVVEEKAGWLRCSSVTASKGCSLVAPRHPAFSSTTGPFRIFRQALMSTGRSRPQGDRDRGAHRDTRVRSFRVGLRLPT